jgi:rod shape-determining protein MreD
MIRLTLGVVAMAFIGLVLQGSVLHAFLPAYLIPNFLLVIVVFLGFFEVSALGVILSFFIGLLFDLFSGALIGPWAGSFVFVYALLAIFAQRLFIHSISTVMISVFVANLISTGIYLALLYQFQPIRTGLLSISLIESFVSALIAPPLFALCRILLLSKVDKGVVRRAGPEIFSLARSER